MKEERDREGPLPTTAVKGHALESPVELELKLKRKVSKRPAISRANNGLITGMTRSYAREFAVRAEYIRAVATRDVNYVTLSVDFNVTRLLSSLPPGNSKRV